MEIKRYLPSVILAPFIKEYIVIESSIDTESNTIPDTSMVMSFRFKGNILRQEGSQQSLLPHAAVAGLRKSSRLFHYAKDSANLLVIFKEGGVSAFSRIPAHHLFENNISTDHLFNAAELAEVIEKLAESSTNEKRIAVVDSFLLAKLQSNKTDLLVRKGIELIRNRKGIIRIKELSSELCISTDAFEKRFRTHIGATPKQYASIVRLRSLIDKYPSYASLTEAAYDAGYFDQAHFIKDFKLFTSQSPTNFFKFPRFW
jgi:AraC-like DNA-binding protein